MGRRKMMPSFLAASLVFSLLVTAGVEATTLESAPPMSGLGTSIRHSHSSTADPAGLVDPVLGPRRLAGGTAGVPAAVGATSGQDAFTAEKKDAINAAVMTAYPSVVVLADPTPSYECHGFTFAAGRFRIYGDQVEKILADQGWILRTAGAHQVGDIAIYRKEGVIRHSGVVSAVQDGTVTRIQSKWGTAGLYEHDPGDVPEDYGRFEIRHRGVGLAAIPSALNANPP